MTYSPDVLAANPELAVQVKRSKAKTPGGQGYGWADDAQSYRRAGKEPLYNPARLMWGAARNAIVFIEGHAKRGGWADEPVVRRVLDALAELKEWTREG